MGGGELGAGFLFLRQLGPDSFGVVTQIKAGNLAFGYLLDANAQLRLWLAAVLAGGKLKEKDAADAQALSELACPTWLLV